MLQVFYNKKFILFLILLIIFSLLNSFNEYIVYAESLSESINEQLENIQLTDLENFLENIGVLNDEISIHNLINDFINGKFSINFNDILNSLLKIIFNNVMDFAPIVITIFTISILVLIISNIKGSLFDNQIGEIILFCSYLFIIIILFSKIILLYKNTIIVIENLLKLMQILSPIMLTLMIASGGKVSATVYNPTVTFLTSTISTIILNVIFPLIYLIAIFSVFNGISKAINLSKLTNFFTDLLKWIFGIIITIFTVFLSIQGITASIYDGISFKAAKYALSSSIPIVGGFIKDGFDLVIAGSVIIKNSIGLAGVFVVFYVIISPLSMLLTFNLALKFIGYLLQSFNDNPISNLCMNSSKCVSYMAISLLVVGMMFFIFILLMVMSANFVV